MVSCADEVLVPRSRARAGRTGRYGSMEAGPRTVSSARITGTLRLTLDVLGQGIVRSGSTTDEVVPTFTTL